MSEEKTPGQVSYEARNVARGRRMGADESTPDSEVLAVIALAYDELPAGMQADEEAGAQAVLDSRTPWGDANITTLAMGPRCAVVSSGTDGDVIKVIGYGETGLEYFESYDEWKRANEGAAAGVIAGQEREERQHARDMAAEDGDLDDCEPTL